MRVLIFIDWFAPAYKAGGPIQSIVNLVNQPIEGIEYRIICSNKDLDGSSLQGIECDEWVWFNERTKVWYNSINKNVIAVIKQAALWKPDLFYINGIYSFYYNFLPIVFGSGVPKIISARGMLHAGALSQKSFRKKIYLAIWKLLKIHRVNSFHATNAEEKNFIENVFGKSSTIYIAPNFPKVLQVSIIPNKLPGFLHLVSIGLISPMKNYLEVLKAVANCPFQIFYSIHGPVKDNQYWQQCIEKIKELSSNIQVKYLADLPSSKVPDALREAHVFILPSKSENFGHAIFEALSAGKPVITSRYTPWNNLKEAMAGINVSVNDDDLSKAICFFAEMDGNEFEKWCLGAKKYSEQAVDVNQVEEQYKRMFFGHFQNETSGLVTGPSTLKI